MRRIQSRRVIHYGLAIGMTLLALLITLALLPWNDRMVGAFFYLAVLMSARYSGIRPAIVVMILSTLALNYFVLEPSAQFSLYKPNNILQLCIFNFVSISIIIMMARFRSSKTRIEQLNQQLQSDIQAREQAESALRESEAYRHLAVDLTHIGVWEFDVRTGKAVWNENMFHLMGLVPDQYRPSYAVCAERAHPDDRALMEHLFQDSIANRTDFAQEYRVIHPDTSVHWLMIRARPLYDQDGHPTRVLGVLLNIDPFKQAEFARRDSDEKFRQLAENIQDVFWISEINPSRLIYVSPAYETVWGRGVQDLYQNFYEWIDAIHPDDRDRMMQALQNDQQYQSESVVSYEYRILRPDGSIRWIRNRSFPIRSQTGVLIRLAGIAEDITHKHAIEQIKKDFISIVSHELRTPLTAIRGSLGLLATGIYNQKPERQAEMLSIAARQSDRLVRLVNDILDLGRLESGHAQLKIQPCEITSLIQQSVEIMQAQAQQSGLTIQWQPLDGKVAADPDAIIQALTNLLSNAIKFSESDRSIEVTAQHLEGGMVEFSVTDQGRGIPEDKLEMIFEQFQQVDASDSRDKGGTGLGLAICRTIVEQHGGQIWVKSQLGVGSTFLFTLRSL
jgi:PAS domain S-box-containing protein